jgi:hypothetical protein
MRYKVSQNPASFNLPLHRAFAHLMAHGLACRDEGRGEGGHGRSCMGGSGEGSGSSSSTLGRVVAMLKARRGFARCLLEHPLRTQALSVQVEYIKYIHILYIYVFI